MARSKSSKRWLKEHFDDAFVHRAQREGFRSRAVYKLQELDQKYGILKPGMTVVDLGAAPGAWAQYAAPAVGRKGRVVALDMLPMDPVAGVEFLQGDFREAQVLAQLVNIVGSEKVDLVMSDMAPKLSGMQAIDQPRAMYLVELVVDFAGQTLRPGGAMLTKIFQGEGFDALLKDLRPEYEKVIARKPRASRARSREMYLLATGRKL